MSFQLFEGNSGCELKVVSLAGHGAAVEAGGWSQRGAGATGCQPLLLHSLLPPHTEGDRGQQDLHQALLSVLLSTTGMTLPCSCSKLSGQMLSMVSVLEVKVVLQAGPSQPEKHLQLPS